MAFGGLDDHQNSAYFTYRPLSNLPTPPPTFTSSQAGWSDDSVSCSPSPLPVKYLGPAIHLVNLIPSSASLIAPSVDMVQAILSRAHLPIETVALAVGILDSLDAKFARAWRTFCPLQNAVSMDSMKSAYAQDFDPLPPTPPQEHAARLHIDAVRPELIVLSALVIAVKFMDDAHASPQTYCVNWGGGMWSCEQLNATERCIMDKLNYRILPLSDERYLNDAMVDMQLAGQCSDDRLCQPCTKSDRYHLLRKPTDTVDG